MYEELTYDRFFVIFTCRMSSPYSSWPNVVSILWFSLISHFLKADFVPCTGEKSMVPGLITRDCEYCWWFPLAAIGSVQGDRGSVCWDTIMSSGRVGDLSHVPGTWERNLTDLRTIHNYDVCSCWVILINLTTPNKLDREKQTQKNFNWLSLVRFIVHISWKILK